MNNSKEPFFLDERLIKMEKKLKNIEDNIQKKFLDLKEKKKEMRKSLQIIEKIDQQQNQSDEDLNLIWKTINTIVVNSKCYFEDVKKEMERKIQEFKLDITGLLNFDDVKDVIDVLKGHNLDLLMTEKKSILLFEQLKKDFGDQIENLNSLKFNEISKNYEKLNELIKREKLNFLPIIY